MWKGVRVSRVRLERLSTGATWVEHHIDADADTEMRRAETKGRRRQSEERVQAEEDQAERMAAGGGAWGAGGGWDARGKVGQVRRCRVRGCVPVGVR